MNDVFMKIKAKCVTDSRIGGLSLIAFLEIVDQVAAEYNNGWIPCSDRMPDEHDSIFAKFKGTDNWHKGMFEKTSDDVNVTVEYEDGERATKTMHTIDGRWNIQGCVKYKVIAWQPLQPLPEPYQPKGV